MICIGKWTVKVKRLVLQLEKETVEILVVRKKIKNMYLRINQNGQIAVSAPLRLSEKQIGAFVHSKESWITKQIEKYRMRRQEIAAPNTVWWLGSIKPLMVKSGTKNTAEMCGDVLYLTVKDGTNQAMCDEALEQWMRQQADVIFNEQMTRIFHQVFAAYHLPMPKLHLRKMKTLWGSCTPSKNKITLNTVLLKYDIRYIEYVVLHELTHLLYIHHDADFYRFLSAHMPDWKERRTELNNHSGRMAF